MAELPHAASPKEAPEASEEPERTARESRVTVRPEFEPSELARRIESSHRNSTQPPEPTFATLRESCRALRVAELDLASLEEGWEADDDAAAPSSSAGKAGGAPKNAPPKKK
jgi:hypothetical protein